MRKALFATVVAGGIAPLFLAGCTSNSGPTLANSNTSTDWFGAKKLAALFKREPAQMSTSDTSNPQDPTSLAYKGKPVGADLYVTTAKLKEKQNDLAAAEHQYQRALEIAPGDVSALLGYAHLLDRQGKLDQATGYYLQAVGSAPADAAAHNDLGLCYARRGRLNESLVELTKAAELAPEKPLYRNNIATVLVEMGQYDRALEHMLAGQTPAVAHYNLACLLQQRGQLQAAGYHFAQAAAHDPSLVAAREWAGKLGAGGESPRLTDVRPVERPGAHRPNTQWTQPAAAEIPETASSETRGPNFGGAMISSSDTIAQGQRGIGPQAGSGATAWQQTGADRNWAAYEATKPAASPSGGAFDANSAAHRGRGSAYGAIPPTPETVSTYQPVPTTADLLPPIDQSVPRY